MTKRARKGDSIPRRRTSMRRPQNRLVLFLKEPRMGRVKRRLAVAIGDAAALKFYRGLAAATLRLARDPRWRTTLALTPDCAVHGIRARLRGLTGRRFDAMPQGPGDLGRRMAAALMRHRNESTIIVGTDIPGLGAAHIVRAFRALRGADAVFGPAADGGFWLVGMRRPLRAARAFAKVRWSTSHALADVRANLPANLRMAMVQTLEDVDDEASYRRWREAVRRKKLNFA